MLRFINPLRKKVLTLVAGSSLLALSSCSSSDTILQGVNEATIGLTSSLVNAYFEAIADDEPTQLQLL